MTQPDKLMGCPFCGIVPLPLTLTESTSEVNCGGPCKVRPTAYGATIEEAIAAWNARADLPNKDSENG